MRVISVEARPRMIRPSFDNTRQRDSSKFDMEVSTRDRSLTEYSENEWRERPLSQPQRFDSPAAERPSAWVILVHGHPGSERRGTDAAAIKPASTRFGGHTGRWSMAVYSPRGELYSLSRQITVA